MFILLSRLLFILNLLKPRFSPITIIASIFFFDKYFIELIVTLLAGIWLINGRWFCRILAYILACGFIIISTFQYVVIQRTGNFFPHLALENIFHISLVINGPNVIALGGIVLTCVLFLLLTETLFKQPASGKFLVMISVLLSMAGLTLVSGNRWLPHEVLAQRAFYLEANDMKQFAPAAALYAELVRKKDAIIDLTFSKEELQELRKFGFSYNPNSRYPLMKYKTPSQKIPFELKTLGQGPPNVIVFFSEGLSNRALSVDNSNFPEITPNLVDFAKNSMVVQNYFNHTASTYRGLLGQLCSFYPASEWSDDSPNMRKTNYFSITQIFKHNHYQTIFLTPHFEDYHLDKMMQHLGFDQVLSGKILLREFLADLKPSGNALSDHQLYNAVIELLKRRAREPQTDKPFFLAMYSLGTHAWLDSKVDGITYKNGRNNALNTIHNLDDAFGKFWQYYKNSPYADNTMVIFTADHAHFYDESYLQAIRSSAQTDYQRIFADRIPLIIHDPFRNLPKSYNAWNSTSVDFAPSLVHYLGFKNDQDPFLGGSIFLKERKFYNNGGIAAFSGCFFQITQDGIYPFTDAQKGPLFLIKKFIRACQSLEAENRIWDNPPSI